MWFLFTIHRLRITAFYAKRLCRVTKAFNLRLLAHTLTMFANVMTFVLRRFSVSCTRFPFRQTRKNVTTKSPATFPSYHRRKNQSWSNYGWKRRNTTELNYYLSTWIVSGISQYFVGKGGKASSKLSFLYYPGSDLRLLQFFQWWGKFCSIP